ncbi:hypothetical protein [Vibrio cyclitrophicus]|uniref:hypothetical protein n=1 Tax=Vibrio cyclitrophicus TaxID=47951 RepID=UPI003990A8A7
MVFFRYFTFIFLVLSVRFATAATTENDITICTQNEALQQCIDNAKTNIISLSSGIHETSGIFISSNQTFIVPDGSTLKLADDAVLNGEAFGGDANFVIASIGKPNQLVSNVHIIINGEIDGNKDVHVYEKGGVEGIDWKWVENSTISGSGVVHSANGDGIDLDAVHNIQISDITVKDNGDSGIHFGSPRPIMPSTNNVVIGVTSINNGFRVGKSGFDLSCQTLMVLYTLTVLQLIIIEILKSKLQAVQCTTHTLSIQVKSKKSMI